MKDIKIRSITEAFSMQPATLYVGMTHSWLENEKQTIVAKIVEEDVDIVGDPWPYYIGYDKDGNRLFEYKKGTVNVTYEVG